MPPVAVSMAVCVEVTAEAVALNPMLVEPDDTVTDAGTVTALLLLLRFTAKPPLPALCVNLTVQASVTAPVSDPLEQESVLSWACELCP